MNTVMVIPSYWTRNGNDGLQPDDVIYDHPTPLDQEGTLARTLESLHVLEDTDYSLVILACSTARDLHQQVEMKVRRIVEQANPPVRSYVLSHTHLDAMHETLRRAGRADLMQVLSLTGYSNVRNMCLFIPLIMGADVAVLIDDDEIFTDPKFMRKAREHIGSRFIGQTIDGVAGYYLNTKGTYYDDVPDEIHWMTYWDRFGSKREAFDQFIPGEPRLKLTPFAFGGCMVVHRSLFRSVPFDPCVTRGEDTDYVLNARMFGFNFFLDNQLSILHRPPQKTHPTWQRLREDIFRLLYSRAKLMGQSKRVNMTFVEAEDFDPYPGEFLRETLDDKILKTNLILALDYLANNRVEDAKETIRNIWLANSKAIPTDNPFEIYLGFQTKWRSLRKAATNNLKRALVSIVQQGQIYQEQEAKKAKALRAEFESRVGADLLPMIEGNMLFKEFQPDEIKTLLAHSRHAFFDEGAVIIEEGSVEHNLFVILKGRARITISRENEETTVVAEVGEGETLGEVSLLIDAPHSATVTVVEPLEVLQFTRASLGALMVQEPELVAKLMHRLSQFLGMRLRDSNARYASLMRDVPDVADKMLGTRPLE